MDPVHGVLSPSPAYTFMQPLVTFVPVFVFSEQPHALSPIGHFDGMLRNIFLSANASPAQSEMDAATTAANRVTLIFMEFVFIL